MLKQLLNRTPKLTYSTSTQDVELKTLEIMTNVERLSQNLNRYKKYQLSNPQISKTMLDSRYLPIQMCREAGLDNKIINLFISHEYETTKANTTNVEFNSLNEFVKDSSNTTKTQRVLLKNTILHNQAIKSMS